MNSAPQPRSGPGFELAPGVNLVVSKTATGNAYELINHRSGVRQTISEQDHAVLTLLRQGAGHEAAAGRFGGDGGRRLCERLVGAGLLVRLGELPAFLPDDRPKLHPGCKLVRSPKQGVILCHPPTGAPPVEMREVEAIIAKAFDGAHSVLDIVEAARVRGIPATLQTMVSFLKELGGMGCLEGYAPKARTPSPSQPLITDADLEDDLPVVQGKPHAVGNDLVQDVVPDVTNRIDPVSPQEAAWASVQVDMSSVPREPSAEGEISIKLQALKSLELPKDEKPSATKWIVIGAAVVVLAGGAWFLHTHPGVLGGAGQTSTSTPAPTATATFAAATTNAPTPTAFAMSSATPPASRTMVLEPPAADGSAPVMAAGYIAPGEPIVVGATIGGRVMKVSVKPGDVVKQDQVLVQLDDSQARAQYSLANAQKRSADLVLARTKTLFASQAATQVDLDKATGAADVARAQLEVYAQQIEQAKIRAPISKATIMEVLVHPGEVITAQGAAGGGGVVKLADLTQLEAQIDVNEGDVSKLHAGEAADIVPDAAPDKRYSGTVREIAQEADRARGTVQVKVDLQVPDRSLRPGNSVRATFKPASAGGGLQIPRTAITGNSAVFVVGPDGRTKRRPVVTRPAGSADQLLVVSGVVAGDKIVVDATGVKPGEKVE